MSNGSVRYALASARESSPFSEAAGCRALEELQAETWHTAGTQPFLKAQQDRGPRLADSQSHGAGLDLPKWYADHHALSRRYIICALPAPSGRCSGKSKCYPPRRRDSQKAAAHLRGSDALVGPRRSLGTYNGVRATSTTLHRPRPTTTRSRSGCKRPFLRLPGRRLCCSHLDTVWA